MLRLLVPDTDDSASMQSLSSMGDLEQFVSMVGIDLAGVPVNPFSASLLPGKPHCLSGQSATRTHLLVSCASILTF